MASTPQNNKAAGPELSVAAPIAAATAVYEGDLVKVSSNLIVAVAAVADVVHAMSLDSNPVASLGDQLTRISVLRPGAGVLVRLPLKNGDTIAYDDLVYIGSNVATNPQEISSSSANSAAKVGRCREVASFAGDGSKRALIEFLGASA